MRTGRLARFEAPAPREPRGSAALLDQHLAGVRLDDPIAILGGAAASVDPREVCVAVCHVTVIVTEAAAEEVSVDLIVAQLEGTSRHELVRFSRACSIDRCIESVSRRVSESASW